METATYLVTIDRPGNITSKVDAIRTILTSTDHIFDRDHVHVERFDGDEYNGWVNRETWAVALHLSNDEALYNATLALVDPEGSDAAVGDVICDWVQLNVERQLFPQPGDEPDPWGQLWRNLISDAGSLWRVDWEAIAASFRED